MAESYPRGEQMQALLERTNHLKAEFGQLAAKDENYEWLDPLWDQVWNAPETKKALNDYIDKPLAEREKAWQEFASGIKDRYERLKAEQERG